MCPICKVPEPSAYGGPHGLGFADEGAQQFYANLKHEKEKFEAEWAAKGRRYVHWDIFCEEYEGDMIKCHWSRFGKGRFLHCRTDIWYDFVGGYVGEGKHRKSVDCKHYYKPGRPPRVDKFHESNLRRIIQLKHERRLRTLDPNKYPF